MCQTLCSTLKVIPGSTQPGNQGSEKQSGWWRARPGLSPSLLAPKPGLLVPVALQAPPTWAGGWALRGNPVAPKYLPQISSLFPPDSPGKIQINLPRVRKASNLHFFTYLATQTPLGNRGMSRSLSPKDLTCKSYIEILEIQRRSPPSPRNPSMDFRYRIY